MLARRVGILFENDFVNFVRSNIPPELRIGDVTVTEGDGGVNATLTVTRSRAGSVSSVNYATASGSAGPSNFTSKTGTLQFASGDLTATITVPIMGDPIDEPNESFTVTLSGAVGASIARGHATVTIFDDDPTPVATIDDVHLREGNSGLNEAFIPVHWIVRPHPPSRSTIRRRSERRPRKTSCRLPAPWCSQPGQTTQVAKVTIVGDTQIESKETFFVNLSPAGGGVILADSQGVATIVDDDFDTQRPVIAPKPDVLVEVRMSASSTIAVAYTNPPAQDDRDGSIGTSCTPLSGSLLDMAKPP